MSKIKTALEKIFKDNRIVFWYDPVEELNFEYSELQLDDVKKLTVENNEFSVKYRIVKDEPNKKFLLYFKNPKPTDIDNWLLDLNFSSYEFYTDAVSLILQDMNWTEEVRSVVTKHRTFFNSEKRKNKLRVLNDAGDTEKKKIQKMFSVICNTEPNVIHILLSLFSELARDKSEKYDLICECRLDIELWKEMERLFNYKTDNPTILDLAISLFKTNYDYYLDKAPLLSKDAIVFFSRWIDSARYQKDYELLSRQFEKELQIESQINSIDYKKLLKNNVYSIIEQTILSGIKSDIINDAIRYEDAKALLNSRIDSYWYKQFANFYKALDYAVDFLRLVKPIKFDFNTLEEGYQKYSGEYYKIDLYYRKFLFEYYSTNNSPVLSEIASTIENFYSNNFLLPLNDKWQQLIDRCKEWKLGKAISQRGFFNKFVQPFISKEQKIFVVISDSLRFEIGHELLTRILRESRFFAEIDTMYSTLPSYTQLGMAALLPQNKISYKLNTADVLCDKLSSMGTNSRSKILQNYKEDSIAIQADEFLNKNTATEGRNFVKQYSVFYIYSNTIDKIGDDVDSEVKVIKAVEDEIENIIRILKHIVNCNGSNVIITSDHGFIYQNQKLEESDFSEYDRTGEIIKDSRRFIIGKKLKENPVVKTFSSEALGIESDYDFQITKSINRLRVKRSGSRYVHGGASLQEIVIPVIRFNKKRIGDVENVEVDVIRSFNKITSNQVTISFYQPDVVQDKVQSRELKIGFYSKDSHLISDQVTLNFNSSSSEASLREKKYQFTFIKDVSKYNNQDVFLRLEEKIPNTNQYIVYKESSYRMIISFSSDFNEF